MRYATLRRLFPLLAIVSLAVTVTGIPAQAGTTPAKKPADVGFLAARNAPRLLNARHLTVRGTVARGRCSIPPPRLHLAPGQRAIEADELSIDYGHCTTVWQIGTPVRILRVSGSRNSSSSLTLRQGAIAAGLVSSSAHEYAWTTDVAGFTLTSDQSNISWAWDGQSCIAAASGSATWWWDSNTGWSHPYNNGVWMSTSCSYDDVWSQATFYNGWFCPHTTVVSSYSGVYVEAGWDGSLNGWVNNMWYSNSCLPLYLHSQLARVTG